MGRPCKQSCDQSWKLWLEEVRKFIRPAATDEKPEERFHKSVPTTRGKVQKVSQGRKKKLTKLGRTHGGKDGNSDRKDGPGKKVGDMVADNESQMSSKVQAEPVAQMCSGIQSNLLFQPTLNQNFPEPVPQLSQRFSKCQNKPVAQLNLRMNVAMVPSYLKEERQKRAMEVDSARPGDRAVSSRRSVRGLTAMFEGS